MFRTLDTRQTWIVTLAAAGILLINMGARQSLGLFVAPIEAGLGVDIASISLALAIGQFVRGAVQPLAGALSDRFAPARVLCGGIVLMALGSALTPWAGGVCGLIVSQGLLTALGSGTCSFSVLLGAAAQSLPAKARGTASGIINAGSSLGQFVFAPILQRLIQTLGWVGAMGSMALMMLAALPLVRGVTHGTRPSGKTGGQSPWRAIREALRERSYLLLHAGFFTCGFHVAFLVTHLPGEVGLCHLPPSVASWSLAIIGLANVLGSLVVGACIVRYRSKIILFWMYASRALLIVAYLAAPRTALTFYLFAAGLGLTWLATVPPTAAIVGKLFGVRHLGTLFGLTLLSHQIGAFLGAWLGAWLGGFAIARHGDLSWMWSADMALAAMAALVNLPIREEEVQREI